MQSRIIEIRQKISSDWLSEPIIGESCIKIFDYVTSRAYSEVCHLTNSSLSSISNSSNNDLFKIINYLTGSISILTVGLEFIDNEDLSFEITGPELEHYKKERILVSPLTGEVIESPENNIFVFFKPSESLEELKSDK